jgi:predicted RNase H-like nuclease (RuvC/YqgF family)
LRTRQEAEADSAARLDAVEQAQQLRLDLRAAQTHVENLSEENEKLTSKVRRLTKRIVRFEREVKKTSLTLYRLSPAVTDDEDVQQ